MPATTARVLGARSDHHCWVRRRSLRTCPGWDQVDSIPGSWSWRDHLWACGLSLEVEWWFEADPVSGPELRRGLQCRVDGGRGCGAEQRDETAWRLRCGQSPWCSWNAPGCPCWPHPAGPHPELWGGAAAVTSICPGLPSAGGGPAAGLPGAHWMARDRWAGHSSKEHTDTPGLEVSIRTGLPRLLWISRAGPGRTGPGWVQRSAKTVGVQRSRPRLHSVSDSHPSSWKSPVRGMGVVACTHEEVYLWGERKRGWNFPWKLIVRCILPIWAVAKQNPGQGNRVVSEFLPARFSNYCLSLACSPLLYLPSRTLLLNAHLGTFTK